jgi:hypothetical protein
MDNESQRTVAAWVIISLSFLGVFGFLYMQGGLTNAVPFVGLYWFNFIVLTIIGVFPPPWEPFTD